jgi:hypothetical protein
VCAPYDHANNAAIKTNLRTWKMIIMKGPPTKTAATHVRTAPRALQKLVPKQKVGHKDQNGAKAKKVVERESRNECIEVDIWDGKHAVHGHCPEVCSCNSPLHISEENIDMFPELSET